MTLAGELVATALLGTARREPHEAAADPALRGILDGLADRSPEARLLAAAGALAVYLRAGEQPPASSTDPPPPAPPDDRPLPPPRAAEHLRIMLAGHYDEVLDEWMAIARERGLRAPPETLPDIATTGDAGEVGGPRRAWLADLAGETHEEEQDPDVEELEQAAQSKRKPERVKAKRILATLPSSSFAGDLGEAAAPILTRTTGLRPRIEVAPPTEVDPSLAESFGKRPRSTGERTWLLGELLSRAPLATWTAKFGATPQQIARTTISKEWRDEVRLAWATAAVTQSEQEWARALLEVVEDPDLLQVLPREEAEDYAAKHAGELDPPFEGVWGEALSRAWLKRLKDDPEAAWAVPRLAPATLGRAEDILEAHAESRDWTARNARRALELLRFRRAMLAALTEEQEH